MCSTAFTLVWDMELYYKRKVVCFSSLTLYIWACISQNCWLVQVIGNPEGSRFSYPEREFTSLYPLRTVSWTFSSMVNSHVITLLTAVLILTTSVGQDHLLACGWSWPIAWNLPHSSYLHLNQYEPYFLEEYIISNALWFSYSNISDISNSTQTQLEVQYFIWISKRLCGNLIVATLVLRGGSLKQRRFFSKMLLHCSYYLLLVGFLSVSQL